mmetsp:Transcript_29324/g.80392  ORF Transcript_29324/g.80392 Transcript_29324/m.80392 type:complete len:241 (+) Transcript_29324:1-723(+)
MPGGMPGGGGSPPCGAAHGAGGGRGGMPPCGVAHGAGGRGPGGGGPGGNAPLPAPPMPPSDSGLAHGACEARAAASTLGGAGGGSPPPSSAMKLAYSSSIAGARPPPPGGGGGRPGLNSAPLAAVFPQLAGLTPVSSSLSVPLMMASSRICFSFCCTASSLYGLSTCSIIAWPLSTLSSSGPSMSTCMGSSSSGPRGLPSCRPMPSLMAPFPRITILQPDSRSIRFWALPRGPMSAPKKL